MAATVNLDRVQTRRLYGLRLVTGTIDMGSSYPTGGESISLPLAEVKGMFIENKGGYIYEYDKANKKVKAYYVNQAVNEGGTATYTVTIKEVANGTDLSALTGVSFLAWGW